MKRIDVSRDWYITRQLLSGETDRNARFICHGSRCQFQISGRFEGWNPTDDIALERLCDYLNGLSLSREPA
jgi:hypothetical protein